MREMPNSAQSACSGTRNLSIDLFRIVAFCLVVSLHALKGRNAFVDATDIVARIAVPFFLLVAGYFSYGLEPCRIARRTAGIARMLLIASLAYCALSFFGLNGWAALLLSSSDPISKLGSQLANLLLYNAFPPAYPLWYLFALLYAYLLYYAARRLRVSDRVFCAIFLSLLIVGFALSEFSGIIKPLGVPRRTWFFFGVPCFALGVAARRHERFLRALPTGLSAGLVAIGAALAFAEYGLFGLQECYVGTFLALAGIFSLCLRFPQPLSADSRFAHIPYARISATAYLVHFAVLLALRALLAPHMPSNAVLELVTMALCIVFSLAIGAITSSRPTIRRRLAS